MIVKNFEGSPDEYYSLVHKDAMWFYAHCLDSGFSFNVTDGKLKVSPAQQIDHEMASLIFTHKLALIEIITSQYADALVV